MRSNFHSCESLWLEGGGLRACVLPIDALNTTSLPISSSCHHRMMYSSRNCKSDFALAMRSKFHNCKDLRTAGRLGDRILIAGGRGLKCRSANLLHPQNPTINRIAAFHALLTQKQGFSQGVIPLMVIPRSRCFVSAPEAMPKSHPHGHILRQREILRHLGPQDLADWTLSCNFTFILSLIWWV